MVLFFPGQGTQFTGMGEHLCSLYPSSKEIYTTASEILGFDIIELSKNEAELTDTKNAQPAILIYQHVLTELLKSKISEPAAAAGHSLGEFSALLAAEMLDFKDALKLVRKRGELMSSADPDKKGAMAVVLGLDDDAVIRICKEISETKYVEPVNFNTPGQIVISGLKEGIELASPKLLEAGAKRVMPLAVSGAFHSKLMDGAAEEFKKYLDALEFKAPKFPIVSNVTAEFYDEKNVKELLYLQMKSPVQWVKSIEFLSAKGYDKGIEVSNASILQGMIKKINKDFVVENVSSIVEL